MKQIPISEEILKGFGVDAANVVGYFAGPVDEPTTIRPVTFSELREQFQALSRQVMRAVLRKMVSNSILVESDKNVYQLSDLAIPYYEGLKEHIRIEQEEGEEDVSNDDTEGAD